MKQHIRYNQNHNKWAVSNTLLFGIEVWGKRMPSSSCNEIKRTHIKCMHWHLRASITFLYITFLETFKANKPLCPSKRSHIHIEFKNNT